MTLDRLFGNATTTPFNVPSVQVAGAHSSVSVDVERMSAAFALMDAAFDVDVPAQAGQGNTRAIHGGGRRLEGNCEIPTSAAR